MNNDNTFLKINPDIISIPQGAIITALREYAKMKEGFHLVNEDGICAALSICFAFSYLIRPDKGVLTPAVFKKFMKHFKSLADVEEFFIKLEELTELYQKSKNPNKKQKILKKLNPLWAQLTIIDFAMLLYNQDKKYPTFLFANNSDLTLKFMGLKSVAAASMTVSADELAEFLFPKEGNKLCPFTQGGTYLVAFPGHLCALNISQLGEVLFYDPNHYEKITDEKQLAQYKALFKQYSSEFQCPVDILAVQLINQSCQQDFVEQHASSVSDTLCQASQYYLQKSHLEAKQRIKTLCHIVTPDSEAQFIEIIKNSQPQERISLIKEITRTISVEREFGLYHIILTDRSLRDFLIDDHFWLREICFNRKIDLLIFVLQFLPWDFHLEKSIEQIATVIKYLDDSDQRSRLKDLIRALIVDTCIFKHGSRQDNLIFFIKKFDKNIPIIMLALQEWQNFCQEIDIQSALYFSPSTTLLEYFIQKDYPQSVITTLLDNNSYLWTGRDYYAALRSTYEYPREIVFSRKKNNEIPEALLPHEAVFAASSGDTAQLEKFLQSWPPLTINIINDCFECALMSQNFIMCRKILQYRPDCGTFDFFHKMIQKSVARSLKSQTQFIIFQTPTPQKQRIIEEAFIIAFIEGKKDIALLLKHSYGLDAQILEHPLLKFSMKGQGYCEIETIEIALHLNATEQQWADNNLWPQSPLNYAIAHGKKELLEQLLQHSNLLSARWPSCWTPLSVCAFTGDTELAKFLIEKGADLNALDDQGCSACYYAVYYGNTAILDLFVQHGADLNLAGHDNYSPLYLAAEAKQYFLFQALLKKGAEPENIMPVLGIMKQKLQDPIAYEKWERTLLQHAISFNKEKILKSMLDNRLRFDTSHQSYQDILCAVVSHKNNAALQALIQLSSNKINLDIIDPKSRQSLLICAIQNGSLDIVKTLLEKGACPNATPYPPLYYAVLEENNSMIALLMTYGARYDNEPDILRVAIEIENIDIIRTLLLKPPADKKILKEALDFAKNIKNINPEVLDTIECVLDYPESRYMLASLFHGVGPSNTMEKLREFF